MKRFGYALLSCMVGTAAMAMPAMKGVWKTITLDDGTEVKVELRGDEYCKFWTAENGLKYIENAETGKFRLTDMNELKAMSVKARAMNAAGKPLSDATPQAKAPDYTGKKKGLIILVDFKDQKFKKAHTQELYTHIINDIDYKNEEFGFEGSVKDYFLSQSYGQMEFDFDVVGPVSMPYSYKYYGQNNPMTGGDKNAAKVIEQACILADEFVDYKDYDWDGNNDVEQVFIVYAGYGEASYPDQDRIWPHKSSLTDQLGNAPILDGVRVSTYACSCELNYYGKIDGIGTICHEFSHCLGLPDFYDTYDAYNGAYGTGAWDIMCVGGYNNNSFTPANYTAHERMMIGWLEPKELKNNATIEAMKPINDAPEAYIIYNENFPDEYYMLESRQPVGWDKAVPGQGLLITHIDYNKRAWDYNCPNSPQGQKAAQISNPHERCTIIMANNSKDAPEGQAYPYAGNNSLTNTSVPAGTLFNANTDGTKFMNINITDITQNADGTMSFAFENLNTNSNDYELPSEANRHFYESFDHCDGDGGNDGKFSGSTVGKGNFVGYTDNDGWTSESAHGAARCAMFGSSVIPGDATTPAIEIEGECHLLFKAAPYTDSTTETKTLNVEVVEGDATLSMNSVEMKNDSWSVFDITITGSGAQKIKFSTDARFFLDKVCVTKDPTSGVESVVVDENAVNDNRIYNLQGIYLGTDMNVLPQGIYIVNGKKIIK